jgi:hypothetical protein
VKVLTSPGLQYLMRLTCLSGLLEEKVKTPEKISCREEVKSEAVTDGHTPQKGSDSWP